MSTRSPPPSPPPLYLVSVAAAVALIIAAIPFLQVGYWSFVLIGSAQSLTHRAPSPTAHFCPPTPPYLTSASVAAATAALTPSPSVAPYSASTPPASSHRRFEPQAPIINLGTPHTFAARGCCWRPGFTANPVHPPHASPPPQLLFMGIVFDVRSAAVFYGRGQGCTPCQLQPIFRFNLRVTATGTTP
jgi:hypothetical protein